MPPITETEQLQQLREEVNKLSGGMAQISLDIKMLLVTLRGNKDVDPSDRGLFGDFKDLKTEVHTLKEKVENIDTERTRERGMFIGGVAVGTAACGLIAFLVNHFLK